MGRGLSARKDRAGGPVKRVCIIGVGKMLAAAQEAAERLSADGIEATVWDPRVVKPLDPAMIGDAGEHRLVVTIEDGLRHGGIGSMIADDLQDSSARVEVLGVPTDYLPHGKPDDILASLGLDGAGVADTIRRALGEL